MLNIQVLVDDARCFEEVRSYDGPEVWCPSCGSAEVIKKLSAVHHNAMFCQETHAIDDLTKHTIFGRPSSSINYGCCAFSHELNLSSRQIAKRLDLNEDDVRRMTSQLRKEVVYAL